MTPTMVHWKEFKFSEVESERLSVGIGKLWSSFIMAEMGPSLSLLPSTQRIQSFTSTLSGHSQVQGKNLEVLPGDPEVTVTDHHRYTPNQGGSCGSLRLLL